MKTVGELITAITDRFSRRFVRRSLIVPADIAGNFPLLPSNDALVRMLAEYRKLRKAGSALQNQLADRVLAGRGVEDSGRKLGLLRGKAFVMENEHDVAVVLDHALFCHRVGGLNIVERCARSFPPGNADSQVWLEGLRRSHHSVFMAAQLISGFGMQLVDIFTGEFTLVADVNMSETADPGFTMAARLVPLGAFSATTGAALPIRSEGTLVQIKQYAERLVPKLSDVRDLDSSKAAELQTFVTRICLAAHASSSCLTSEPGELPLREPIRDNAAAPGVFSRKRKFRRNEQCPCGSGEKYKRCCGRGVC